MKKYINIKDIGKKAKNLAKGTLGFGVVFTPKIIDKTLEIVDKIIDLEKEKVSIPSLYDKDFPTSLDIGTKILNDLGFLVVPVKLPLNKAHPKYRHCEEYQIVNSKPRHKQKVKKGSIIHITYITSELINQSQKIFDIKNQEKIEKYEKRKITNSNRKKKLKKDFINIINNTKYKVEKSFKKDNKDD